MLACKDQILFLRKSQTQPLIFAAVLPAAAVRMGVTRITFLSILFMMLYLLCAACASFLLARYLSRPIDRMLQSIPLSGSDENAGNDLVYLENAVHALLQGDQVTRSQLETFKPYALNTLLTQLLFNDLSADAFGSRLCDMLDIQLYYRHFVAMSLLTGTDLFLHDRLNPSFAKAHENDYISIYFCDIDARQKAVIFNYNDQQLLDRLVDSVYAAVCAHTTVRAAGVGASYDSSDALSRSYEEALFALNCRMVDRDLPVLYYRDITLPRSNAVYLPNTDAIISALLAGDAQKALDLAQRQIDASAGKSAAPLGTLRHLYYLLATLAPKALAEQGYPCTQLYQCVNAILSETSVGAMQALLETSYTQGVSQLCAANEIGTLCISDVLSYLHAHYADVSLSLNLTAAHFNVSASYLSRVFKNTVNVNFLDYLNSYRIDQAKTLLHSDATMLTIAQQVGFDNDATFRRLFKKYTGTTPSRYKALRAAP